MMAKPRIRPATVSDAAALTEFARSIFLETFGPMNEASHIEPYVASAFTEAVQAEEIGRAGTFTLLVVDETDRIRGYAYVARGAPAEVRVGEGPIEIKRFYVASDQHGRGVAAALMQAEFERSREAGARTVWLGVWEENARAIAFYHKQGFVQAGTQRFLLGDDLQTDWVMQNVNALR